MYAFLLTSTVLINESYTIFEYSSSLLGYNFLAHTNTSTHTHSHTLTETVNVSIVMKIAHSLERILNDPDVKLYSLAVLLIFFRMKHTTRIGHTNLNSSQSE